MYRNIIMVLFAFHDQLTEALAYSWAKKIESQSKEINNTISLSFAELMISPPRVVVLCDAGPPSHRLYYDMGCDGDIIND
jgi:hypothetical protein